MGDPIDQRLRSHPAWERGRIWAEEEIAGGKLGYRQYGKLNIVLVDEVAAVLLERYQIALSIVGACITDMDTVAEAEAYNERMIAEFISRFDQDVVRATYREVERKRKKRAKKNRGR